MKVAELIEELQGFNPEAEVTWNVSGDIVVNQELEGKYYGRYDFDHYLDRAAYLDDIDEVGKRVRIDLWVS